MIPQKKDDLKRILYLTFYFRPDLCAGSFRNSPLAATLAGLAAERNIRIDLYTTIPNRYRSYETEFEPTERVGPLTIHRLPIPSHNSGRLDQALSFLSYYRQVLRLTRHTSYDLVFASSSRFFTSWLGYRIAARTKARLVVDIRDLFSSTLLDLSGSALIRKVAVPLIHHLEKKVYQRADYLNLISKGFLPHIPSGCTARMGFEAHGTDPEFIEAFRKLNRKNEKRSEPAEPVRVLYAGNIGDGQALHRILPDVAARLRESHLFTVIGDGSAAELLRDAVEREGLGNLILQKPVSRRELIREYVKADILFLHLEDAPSMRRVLPSKLFEMAATERPIAAGVQGYSREFIEAGINGAELFSPGDVEGAVGAIRRLTDTLKKESPIDRSAFIQTYSRPDSDRRLALAILHELEEVTGE